MSDQLMGIKDLRIDVQTWAKVREGQRRKRLASKCNLEQKFQKKCSGHSKGYINLVQNHSSLVVTLTRGHHFPESTKFFAVELRIFYGTWDRQRGSQIEYGNGAILRPDFYPYESDVHTPWSNKFSGEEFFKKNFGFFLEGGAQRRELKGASQTHENGFHYNSRTGFLIV